METSAALSRAPAPPPGGAGGLGAGRVGELLSLLARGIRARQMYQPNNPVYQRFLEGLGRAFATTWRQLPAIRVVVEESAFRIDDELVTVGEGRDSLAFFFFKEGIRHLTFLPGFEEELERFFDVVIRARQAGPAGDDLISLLWEQEFAAFEYGYVDLLAEGVELPVAPSGELPVFTAGMVVAELAIGGESGEPAVARPGEGKGAGILSADDFRETLYFLDPAELEALRAELAREWARDLKRDVLNALFDRIEDGRPERQDEILGILGQLLPAFIARGDLATAATVLRELDMLLGRDGVLDAERRNRVAELFAELSGTPALEQLIQALEAGDIQPSSEDLSLFLAHLHRAALPTLLRAVERVESSAVRTLLDAAIEQLGGRCGEDVVRLVGAEEESVATGATRLAGRLRLGAAAAPITLLLSRPSADVRLAAVEALVGIRSAVALRAVQEVLDDPVREIRIAAARGLGALRYQPARARFEELLEGRGVRGADLTEKLAFFESYAALAGPEAVPLLDRLLNGRALLGRRQPPEIRGCAATALGRIASPAARASLEQARADADAVVRSAVQRALRTEDRTP